MGAFTSLGARIWPVAPDWSNGMQERLAWSSDIMQTSATGVTQHRSLRVTPRRSFTFDVLAGGQARRVAHMLLAGHTGRWLLPIWPDVQWLTAPLAAGVEEIPCKTAGFDFVVGGKALLYRSVNTWEVVDVDSIAIDHIALSAPTAAAYGPGDRLYPLRRARVEDGAEERMRSSDVSRRSIAFDIDEPCDWPLLVDPTEYLGHLVLDQRPDESDDPTSSFVSLSRTVDYGAGQPVVHNLPGLNLRMQQSQWKLFGRQAHTWFRSLAYSLDGRRVPLWLPSWDDDLQVVAPIAGGGTTLSVEWVGYTLFGKDKPNRKDVRIELVDGTVFHRRITNAIEFGTIEMLTLDASLDGASIAPGQIRQISFMALATLASDEVEIDHQTDADGYATSTTGWQSVVPDV